MKLLILTDDSHRGRLLDRGCLLVRGVYCNLNRVEGARRSQGDYSPIFTSPEATNCFSIITLMIIRDNKIIDQCPTPKHQKIWLPF